MRKPASRFLVPEVDRDRDAAHVRDLQVEHDQIRMVVAHRGAHVLTASHFDDLLAGADERRAHLVPHPFGVGGNEDRGHGGRGYPRKIAVPISERASRSWTSRARNGTYATAAEPIRAVRSAK